MNSTEQPFDWPEKVVEEYVKENLSLFEPGLTLHGQQFHLPSEFGSRGFIDLLCRDSAGNFVILEIKRSESACRDIGTEILQYVAQFGLNHRVKTSKIRCFVISTVWEQMIVAVSNLAGYADFPIYGFHFQLSKSKSVVRNQRVKLLDLSDDPTLAYFSPYSMDFYKTDIDRQSHIAYAKRFLERLCIYNFVMLTFDQNAKSVRYPYALCVALTDQKFEDTKLIKDRLEEFSDGVDEEPYRSLMHKVVENINMNAPSVDREVGYGTPEELASMLGGWTPKIELCGRNLQNVLSVRTAADIASDLSLVETANKNNFYRIIGADHPAQMRETIGSLTVLGTPMPNWRDIMLALLGEYSKSGGSLAIGMFMPKSILVGLAAKFSYNIGSGLPYAEIIQFGGKAFRRAFGILEWGGRQLTKSDAEDLNEIIKAAGRKYIVPLAMPLSAMSPLLERMDLHLSFFEESMIDDEITLFRISSNGGKIERTPVKKRPFLIDDLIRSNSEFHEAINNIGFSNFTLLTS